MIWYRSLAFHIIIWFVGLSIVPMLIISYENYKESTTDITQTSYDTLQQASLLDKKFINNWFHYRITDIQNWSQTNSNINFLNKLKNNYESSNSALSNFIQSDIYTKITIPMESDMLQTVKNYDYISDIYLIDLKGNILYTVEKASDLGTNVIYGSSSSTKFAKAVQQTLKDRKTHFSDLEFYEPSHHTITGFLTAPMLNRSGKMIGVFAIEIKLNAIYNLFKDENHLEQDEFVYYIVGADGLLRSKINKENEVLKLQVNTEQFQLWKKEHGEDRVHVSNEKEYIISYLNPYEKSVYGVHQDIAILGVKWVLIGETNLDNVMHLKAKIIERSFIYLFFILFFVTLFAVVISRYITKPIVHLAEITEEFANGNRDIEVNISTQNEIGILATHFKEMMQEIHYNETLLDEQKHALNAHAIVAITDISGNITYVNEKFIDISGYTKEELIGENHRLLNSGNNSKEYWKEMYTSLLRGEVWHDELRNVKKNGEYYWVNTTIVPFLDEKGNPKSYIAIRTDITEKKADEAALIEARGVAEESVKAKSEFFASMSHEIRTPMNGVIGMLGLLLHSKLSDAQQHQAYLAQSSAKTLLSLIDDILDFSKVEAGKLELEVVAFNIHSEFGDFAEAIAFKAQEKGVAVILDMKDVDIDIIEADSHRIHQILNNLVSNAIKFTQKGYVHIKVVLIKENDEQARVKISIKDTGIGIPKNKISTLFDAFTQVNTSTTREYGGTGLGLAIVKKLILLMDGTIRVESQEGEGSEFFVDIAVKLSSKASAVVPNVVVKDKSVLILDVCKVASEALSLQLKHWGMKVYTHFDVDVQYDIAFINKNDNAMELAEKIQKIHKSTKCVLMTPLAQTANVEEYMDSLFSTHFPQPTTTKDILNALNVLSPEYNKKTIIEEKNTLSESAFPKDVKILLVDDNMVNQLVANGILEEMELEADVANNGIEALKMLEEAGESAYDIVLMDCQMPQMDGYEATRVMRSGELGDVVQRTPVIAMTANAMDGDKEKCFAAGMDEYISKPIDPEKLELVLKKFLLL